jgi:glycosyltransferase involved in cell wall biosynthesis
MSETKVLHIIARMNVGGTARYVGELVKGIQGSKLATGFVQDNEIEDKILEEIPFIRVKHLGRKISPLNDIKSWFELRRIIKELNPEVIHTHTFKAGLIGRLSLRSNKKIHTFHGHLFEDSSFSNFAKFFIIKFERILAHRTQLLISVGEKVGEELREKKIGKNQKWMSIPPGISPLASINKIEAREKLGLPPDGFLVGWLARMVPVKNPDLFVNIARSLPEIKFAMAGGGELLDKIKKSAPPNLYVIGWSDAAHFWSAIDLALSTSVNEGMPISLIEAQMEGIPIIATNVGSTSEVMLINKTGLIAETKSEFASGILHLINEKSIYEKMKTKAKSESISRFDLHSFIDTHLKVYGAEL